MLTDKKSKNLVTMAIILFLYYIYPLLQLLYAKVIGIPFTIENDQLVINVSDNMSILLKLLSDITFAIALLIFYKKTLKEDIKKYFKNIKKNILISLKYWIIGLIIMAICNCAIELITGLSMSTNQETLIKMIKDSPIVSLFIIIIATPLIEEFVFRKSIRDVIDNKILFILLSGLFFGAIHVMSSISLANLLYLIPYTSLGICLSIIYYKTDSIFSAILVHMLHNGLVLLLLLI